MNQVIVDLLVNAGFLALFACLWAADNNYGHLTRRLRRPSRQSPWGVPDENMMAIDGKLVGTRP
jgi:hypothetical protein